MGSKAEETRLYILENVAPIFNKKGYFGTSMTDITSATGLTKGAIYGNFVNKDDLAIQAFNSQVRKVMGAVADHVNSFDKPVEKLLAIVDFYRSYMKFSEKYGGCTIINKGMNTEHQNTKLAIRVKDVVSKLIKSIQDIIDEGKKDNTIKKSIHSENIATRIYAMINGGVFLAGILKKQEPLNDILDQVELLINEIIE